MFLPQLAEEVLGILVELNLFASDKRSHHQRSNQPPFPPLDNQDDLDRGQEQLCLILLHAKKHSRSIE